MPKVRKKHNSVAEDIAREAFRLIENKKQISVLESENKKIKSVLDSFVSENGTETETGSIISTIEYADKVVVLKKTLRNYASLMPTAIEELEKAGLSDCIEVTPVVRDDRVAELYAAGKISKRLMKKIYSYKATYAFSADIKKRFLDEEEE